jgi:hypothetical protein
MADSRLSRQQTPNAQQAFGDIALVDCAIAEHQSWPDRPAEIEFPQRIDSYPLVSSPVYQFVDIERRFGKRREVQSDS